MEMVFSTNRGGGGGGGGRGGTERGGVTLTFA